LESAKTGYLDGPDVGQKWAMAQNAIGPHFCGPLFIWLTSSDGLSNWVIQVKIS
jgi:hypothetical protein